MLINQPKNDTQAVKFVSYTGKYPNLCRGVLTLEIHGERVTFGDGFRKPAPMYRSFWTSGGDVNFSTEGITKNQWIIDCDDLPEHLRQYAEEIDKVFNDNVEHGCCGGCI